MTELIVALDMDTISEEEEVLVQLKDNVTFYKIGLRLFTAHGRRAVDLAHRFGGRVFLDLKLHDHPQTVAQTVQEAHKLGATALSLHLCGGAEMLKAASEVHPRPKLWGIASLTDPLARPPKAVLPRPVKNLARLGWINGIDATICSGWEVEPLRKALPHLDMRFIVPAVWPAKDAQDDPRRVLTPAEAVRLGARCVVLGRSITHAPDRLRAAQAVLSEMRLAAPSALEKP